jgi:hypothetical protein
MTRAFLRALVLVSLFAGVANAGTWGIGSNLGLNVLAADGERSYLALSWAGDPVQAMPGLRLSVRGEEGRTALHLDHGFQLLNGDDFGQSATHTTLGVSYALRAEGMLIPFVSVGAGIATRWVKGLGPGGQSVATLSGVFGGGLGMRREVARGSGTLRAEARYEYVSEGEDLGTVLLPAQSVIGLRLGFDLWLP